MIKKALGPNKKPMTREVEQLLWSATCRQRWVFENHLDLCTSAEQLQRFQQPQNLHDMHSYDLLYLQKVTKLLPNVIPMYSQTVPLQNH